MFSRRVTLQFLAVVLAACLSGCSGETHSNEDAADSKSPRLDQVSLVLNWYPEAEHGGFYAALVHGYYREAGLDVQIIPGGPNAPVIQQVAGRTMTFGIENADRVLLGRAAEADVVAVMAPIQTSPRCLMVHRRSGITRIDDLKNVTLALAGSAPWAAYLQKHATLENVQIVPYAGNVAQFLADENFAQQAYVFSEPFVAEQQGGDPHCLMLSDLGYNPYTSVLITHAETARSSPELVRKMVTASIRGWQSYLEHPDETNRHIGGINPQMGREILDYGVRALKPLCVDRTMPMKHLGRMTAERWKTLAEQLVEVRAIKPEDAHPEQAFTTEFQPHGD